MSPSARVVNPSTPLNTIGPSSMVVTKIPSVHFTCSPLFQNTQSGPSDSTSFVQGFPWFGAHIPPSSPYVGPTPTYAGVSYGSQNPFSRLNFQNSIQALVAPLGSSPFSLFSAGITTPVSVTPALVGINRTQYNTPQVSNPLAFGWNRF